MANTGEVFPTASAAVAESPWSDNTWNTPENIYSNNGATANVTAPSFDSPDQTYVLKAYTFDFSSIPTGSTINGVTCRINTWYRSGQGSGSLDLLQLLDTSLAKVGTNQCSTPVALTTDDTTVITKGSTSDNWGNSLTDTWVKNSNFGVAIGILATAANADVDVDYVTLEIEYTPPAGSNFQRSVADSVGITDIITTVRNIRKTISNSVGVTDTISKAVGKVISLADSVNITDLIKVKLPSLVDILSNAGRIRYSGDVQSYGRANATGMTATSDVELTMKFKFNDIVSQGILRTFLRASNDWSDWQTPTTAYEVALNNDGNWLVNRISTGSRTQLGSTQTLAFTSIDTYNLKFQVSGYNIRAKVWKVGDSEPAWAINYDDTTSGFTTAGILQVGYFRQAGYVSQYLTLDDISAYAPVFSVTLADSVGITDVLVTKITFRRLLADSVAVGDVLTTARNIVKILADTVGITDVLNRSLVKFVALADTIGIADALTTVRNIRKSIANTVAISDALTNLRNIRKTLTDNISISDNLTRVGTFVRSISNSVGITDAISTARNIVKSISDTVGISDSISSALKIVAFIQDTVGISDILTTARNIRKSLSDSVTITDTLSRVGTFVRNISNTMGITDALSTARSLRKTLANAVNITDVLSYQKITGLIQVLLADSVGITDVVTNLRNIRKTISNSVSITDTLTRVGTFYRSVSNSVSITDTLTTARQLFRNIANSVNISDLLSYEKIAGVIQVFLADSVGISDLLSNARNLRRTISNPINISDALSRVGAFYRNIQESISITDALVSLKKITVLLTDLVGITDTLGGIIEQVIFHSKKIYGQVYITRSLFQSVIISSIKSKRVNLTRNIKKILRL